MTCSSSEAFQVAIGSDAPYTLDWYGAGKLATGETISTSTWSADSAEITLHNPTHTTTTSTTFVTGGVYGKIYTVFNTVVTSLGKTDVYGLRLHFTHVIESAY